jgi:hypothetical protein
MGNEESTLSEEEHQPTRVCLTSNKLTAQSGSYRGRGKYRNELYSSIYTDVSSAITDASSALGITQFVNDAATVAAEGLGRSLLTKFKQQIMSLLQFPLLCLTKVQGVRKQEVRSLLHSAQTHMYRTKGTGLYPSSNRKYCKR